MTDGRLGQQFVFDWGILRGIGIFFFFGVSDDFDERICIKLRKIRKLNSSFDGSVHCGLVFVRFSIEGRGWGRFLDTRNMQWLVRHLFFTYKLKIIDLKCQHFDKKSTYLTFWHKNWTFLTRKTRIFTKNCLF